jgi:hypothetical protein
MARLKKSTYNPALTVKLAQSGQLVQRVMSVQVEEMAELVRQARTVRTVFLAEMDHL